jgi:glycosyltransferase involved in cell wall biosynthesis
MPDKKKLAIITSHPIQYNAPLFQLLAERNRLDIKVFYTWGDTVLDRKFDPGFRKEIIWDILLLDGYRYEFLENVSGDKGSHHFNGIINPDIINRIDEFTPDALLIYGWSFKSHFRVMRHYKKRKTIIFRGDSTFLDKQPFYKRWARTRFLRWVYGFVDYALYVGKNNLEYFRRLGLKQTQLIYAPHAIDNKRFSHFDVTSKEKGDLLKQKLGIPADDILFLFAGKLEEKKNPGLLLQAFVQSEVYRNSSLLIVGNGNLEKELKEQYGKYSSIFFLDFQNQSQMPVIYNLADVFVLPSKGPGETWGLSVNEAMACGLPVLVSDKCGCALDLVTPGQNGFVFKSEDLDDICSKLLSFVSFGKPGIKKMGEVSRRKIVAFSFEKFCEATEGLLLAHETK